MTTSDGSVIGTTQIFGSAPRNRAFNVVLLAEGFTAAEQNDFNAACATFSTSFRTTDPFGELAPAINIFRVNVSSTDSGADDPAAAGGTGATARTYFDATFGGNGIRRLLLANSTTALAVAAAQVPQFTAVLVVVNSTVYGGSGGSIGTFSLAGGANEIAIHELGHTAFGLADEYPYYAGGDETGHDHHPATEPGEPNVTVNSNRNTLKWRWAVAATTAIPTMSNPDCSTVDSRPSPVPSGTVGLFEGAHYFHCGAFRPEYDCKMRNLGVRFCAVCRQVVRNRIGPLVGLRVPARAEISAVTRGPDQLDIFLTDVDGRTVSAAWQPGFTGWHGWWHLLGGRAAAGAPVHGVSRSRNKLDIFVTGTDNHTYTAAWQPEFADGWHGWWNLRGGVAAPGAHVTAVSRSANKLDVFVVGSNGGVYTAAWQPEFADGWHGWWRIGDLVVPQGSAVHAVSRSADKLDIFVTDVNGRVMSAAWQPGFTAWHGWWHINGGRAQPGAAVTAVSRSADKLDIFTTGTDGGVYTAAWEPGFADGWHGWWRIPGAQAPLGAPVHAASRSTDKLDVFVCDVNGRVMSAAWQPGFTAWHGWWHIQGGQAAPGAPVTVTSRSANKLDIFVVGTDNRVYTAAWQPEFADGWHGWWQLP